MIYPPIKKLTEKTDSRYSLVIATAKLAREISEDETRDVRKPIIEAIREINDGEEIIVSTDETNNKKIDENFEMADENKNEDEKFNSDDMTYDL